MLRIVEYLLVLYTLFAVLVLLLISYRLHQIATILAWIHVTLGALLPRGGRK
jgi:hypothetical protein